jgi:O-antigen ligase
VGCCGALVLMSISEHPDIPRTLFGIPGINLWNILIANVVINWLRFRQMEELEWDMPRFFKRALLIFCAVMFVAGFRALLHPAGVVEGVAVGVFCAYFINCFKWFLPLMMLYDGIRTRITCRQALCAAMAFYFLISVQVIRHMPLGMLRGSSGELRQRASKILQQSVGYNRDNLSTFLAGASWAAIALASAFTDKRVKWALYGVSCVILLGQALTAGKTGYGTWVIVGVFLGLIRWRKLLILLPAACFVILTLSPTIRQSLFQGFGGKSGQIVQNSDMSEITSGRTVIWPAVIKKIRQAPLFGFGRDGFHYSGVADYVAIQLDDPFPHPHNAYLEWMLDNGIIGLLLIIPFYGVVVACSIKLFRQADGLASAAGGITFSLVCGELIGSLGAQTFYPRESTVVMWAIVGIMMRVYQEKTVTHSKEFSDAEDGKPDFVDVEAECQPMGA